MRSCFARHLDQLEMEGSEMSELKRILDKATELYDWQVGVHGDSSGGIFLAVLSALRDEIVDPDKRSSLRDGDIRFQLLLAELAGLPDDPR